MEWVHSITFILSFISLFIKNIPEPEIYETHFLIFLPIKLSAESTRISLLTFWVPAFLNCFLNEFVIELVNDVISLIGCIRCPNRNPLNYAIIHH